jgi:hypothetical protein
MWPQTIRSEPRRLYEAGSTGRLAHSLWCRRRSTAGQTMINPANTQRPALKAMAGTVSTMEMPRRAMAPGGSGS